MATTKIVNKQIVKSLTEINNLEYTAYNWVEITMEGEAVRQFMRTTRRTPKEAYQASKEFVLWVHASRATFEKEGE